MLIQFKFMDSYCDLCKAYIHYMFYIFSTPPCFVIFSHSVNVEMYGS